MQGGSFENTLMVLFFNKMHNIWCMCYIILYVYNIQYICISSILGNFPGLSFYAFQFDPSLSS